MAVSIFDRTHFLSNNRLKQLLTAAAADGELGRLYWYVEAKVPARLTGTGRIQLQAASWPGMWIPVIAVGADPVISRHWIDLLVEIFKASNPGIEFGAGLTMDDLLFDKRAYEWDDPCWDNVCDRCGAVFPSTTIGVKLCAWCFLGNTTA